LQTLAGLYAFDYRPCNQYTAVTRRCYFRLGIKTVNNRISIDFSCGFGQHFRHVSGSVKPGPAAATKLHCMQPAVWRPYFRASSNGWFCRRRTRTATLLVRMTLARDNTPERLVSAARADEEQGFELKLRPRWLKEFIGQSKAKEQLAIALEAAKSRGEALDHVLLFGPPGLGKTTLATIIANELDVGFQQTSGPALVIQGDLTAVLTNLRERQVLSSTKFTVFSRCWKKSSTPRSKITSSTSSSGRGRLRAPM
jgi:hypothetical protein